MTSKAVVKRTNEVGSLITQELADLVQGRMGEGMEDMQREDYALPFLKILQGLSPEVQRGNPKYNADAKAGDFLNSLTGELFSGEEGVFVIRVAFDKKFIEWIPKDLGGGLAKIYNTKDEAEKGRKTLADRANGFNPKLDNDVVETAQIYCLLNTEAGWRPVVLAWTKTKLKESRRWASLLAEQTATKYGMAPQGEGSEVLPCYVFQYRITTRADKNGKGDVYFVPDVGSGPANVAPKSAVRAAQELRAIIKAGQVKVNYEADEPASDGALTDASIEQVA